MFTLVFLGAGESFSQNTPASIVDENPVVPAVSVNVETSTEVPVDKKVPEEGTDRPVTDLFKLSSQLKDPHSLRDPFKSPFRRPVEPKAKKQDDKAKLRFENGVFTDRPDISKIPLDRIEIVGVLVGKERRAIARVVGEENEATYILREGMTIGDKGEVKAILPGGVVVVEKFINVYGQEEFLETVLPVVGD
jgi:type IV pilus assembly protein PilP